MTNTPQKIDPNAPAFPHGQIVKPEHLEGEWVCCEITANQGMTYRQWLIGMALSGALDYGPYLKESAEACVKAADIVIAKLNESKD